MAHFARLDENNYVTMVTVVSNADMIDSDGKEIEALGIAVCESVVGPGPWVQTSYNGTFRRRYAGLGMKYDQERNAFVTRCPYPTWTLDDNGDWQAPYPQPSNAHVWDEGNLMWVLPEVGDDVSQVR